MGSAIVSRPYRTGDVVVVLTPAGVRIGKLGFFPVTDGQWSVHFWWDKGSRWQRRNYCREEDIVCLLRPGLCRRVGCDHA